MKIDHWLAVMATFSAEIQVFPLKREAPDK